MNMKPLRPLIDAAVAELHKSSSLLYILETGVTGHLLHDIWRMPDSSNTILYYGFPYHRRVQKNLLGDCTDRSFASQMQAIYLATYAYEQGFKITSQEKIAGRPVIGVGVTGAVTTSRELKGGNRVHVCVRTEEGIFVVSCVLPIRKNFKKSLVRYREEQGVLTDLVVLNAIFWATGIKQIPLSESLESEQIQKIDEISWILKPDEATHRPENLFDHVFMPTGELIPVEAIDPSKYILFPGSFKPLTFAHVEMAQMIEQMTGKKVIFQISQQHPTKANEGIPEEELRKRFLQFQYRHPVLFLRGEGLYVEKAQKIPGIKILLGADVVKKLLNPVFYGGEAGRRGMLEELARIGSSFFVMGRVDDETGEFITRDDLDMPPRFAHLFEGVSSRWDISSTAIRAQQKGH